MGKDDKSKKIAIANVDAYPNRVKETVDAPSLNTGKDRTSKSSTVNASNDASSDSSE